MWQVVRSGIFTDRHSVLCKTLKPLIALRSAHTALPVYLVKQLKCLCKIFTKFAEKFHTCTRALTHAHRHTHTRSRACVVLQALSLSRCHIRRRACALAQFSGRSSTTNDHSETGQMAVCYQNLTLGPLGSHSALSLLVGALFKKFGLFLNTPRTKTQSVPRSKHSMSRL